MFHRFRKAALVAVLLLLGSLAAATPAFATTTKCDGPFCVTVVGTKLHVSTIQYSIVVPRGKTFNGYFFYQPYVHGENAHYTAKHKYQNTVLNPNSKKFSTQKYKVNRNFANKTRIAAGSQAPGFGLHSTDDIVIHR